MSKSRGNIVEPQEAFARYGADALRLFMLFSGPPEAPYDWPEEGVSAIGRVTFPWLERVWRMCEEIRELPDSDRAPAAAEDELVRVVHRTVKVVTADFEAFSFNTAIARLMELVNAAYKYRSQGGDHAGTLNHLTEVLLKLLAPMAPYMTEEQWRRRGHSGSIHFETWPSFDESMVTEDEITMIVQINGKVRDTIVVSSDISEDEMRELALASEKVRGHLNGGEPDKIIVRPPKLVNLVVR